MRTCWPFIRWPMPAVKQQSAGTDRRTAHPPRVPWEHGASNRKSHTPAARSIARRRGVLSGPVWLSPRVGGSWRSGPKLGSSGDHPRVCGEKVLRKGCIESNRGSPPRVRGKESPHLQHRGQKRDHPRVCGEKAAADTNYTTLMGSPPRVRGKGNEQFPLTGFFRITPACAGKSAAFVFGHLAEKDHPRVCGEKMMTDPGWDRKGGSPPRVRGKELRQ